MSMQTGKTAAAAPAKCSSCNGPMASPVFCDACHRLYPGVGVNHFQLFNLPPTFDLDLAELRQRYLLLSRGVHPDRHPDDVDAATSLHLSAQLNEAQRVLASDVLRAEYLLELVGGRSALNDRTVQDGVLADTLNLREELAEAQADADPAALEACRAQIHHRYGRMRDTILELARQLPGDDALRARLRIALNSIKYYQKLLADA